MTDKILLIHVNKETQEYNSFERYTVSQISREELLQKVEEYNSNPEKTTTIKVYEDDLLFNLISDERASYGRRSFISDLRDFMRALNREICSLQDVYDDIERLLEEAENKEKNDDYNKVLKDIRGIAMRCIGSTDTSFLSGAISTIGSKVDEVLYVENN